MSRYDWSRLNHLQVGRYDDRGIDFVVRNEAGEYFDVQVKSVRGLNYVFVPKNQKDKCELRANFLLAVVVFEKNDESPSLFLIRMCTWEAPNELFVSRDYEGKASKPEWGLNISQRNMPLLRPFAFEQTVETLRSASVS